METDVQTGQDREDAIGTGAIDQIENDPVPAPASEPEDVIDVLQPKAAQKVWKLSIGKGDEKIEREYVQKPLSYFGKMQWFSLVGEVIDKALAGDEGLKISSFFGSPDIQGMIAGADTSDAETFVQAVGKLLTYAPDFLEKSYCIWWRVPEHDRPVAIAAMTQDPEDGGLSDDDGIEVIEIFIDQNWDALDSFFREKLGTLRDRVQARQKVAESQRSKRSNATPVDIPSG